MREAGRNERRGAGVRDQADRPAELLIPDEPTSHIAPGQVEELEAALDRYEGAVAVPHDRSLLSRFTGEHLGLRAGRAARETYASEGERPSRT
ncbi:hypothetical protein ACFWBV_29565 [Streptomyces sp. NPDC060030]|uniref:hypothetical protein n=1 Tax=Streptomyces sp. NPDC060030 TaxID=3347042 RepID=UPI0036BA57FB